VELIDVNGLTTKEAATALGLLPGTARFFDTPGPVRTSGR
jgi:hypothetical protein